MARCLSDATRAEDTVARVGGDEFALDPAETPGDEALAAVERAAGPAVALVAWPSKDHGLAPGQRSRADLDHRLMRLADRAL